jgi:hypothetical protein
MKQQTLTGFEKYGKTTRRAQFLADMDRIVPWEELQAEIPTHANSAVREYLRPDDPPLL